MLDGLRKQYGAEFIVQAYCSGLMDGGAKIIDKK